MMAKIYAMYKGDKCLATGSLVKLSKDLNISIQTLYFYLTPTYRKRVKEGKRRRELILLK